MLADDDEIKRMEREAGLGQGSWRHARRLKQQLRRDRIAHLRSIHLDAMFVREVHGFLGKPPALANLRCGVWYIAPDISSGHCYFKSTDGHAGKWAFSLSRINLNAALAAATHGMSMIVDATRSGKRFPDALTKTVPIWCCVINRAVARRWAQLTPGDGAGALGGGGGGSADATGDVPEDCAPGDETAVRPGAAAEWDCSLRLPCWVSPSEASQIERIIEPAVASLCAGPMSPIVDRLCRALRAPLAPFWLAAGEPLVSPPRDGSTNWVVCVAASRVMGAAAAREAHSWSYVQGAADDEENWARGLKPELWWRCVSRVLHLAEVSSHQAAEEELSALQQAELEAWAPEASCGGGGAHRRLAGGPSGRGAPTTADYVLGVGGGQGSGRHEADAGESAIVGEGGWEAAPACHENSAGGCDSVVAGAPGRWSHAVPLWDSGLLLGSRDAAAAAAQLPSTALLNVGSPDDISLDSGVSGGVTSSRGASGSSELGGEAGSVDGLARGSSDCGPRGSGAYCHAPVCDGKRAQPRRDSWQICVFPPAIRFALARLGAGDRVLVFCDRGDSRAPTVAAAILLALFTADGKRLCPPPPPADRRVFCKDDVRARLAVMQGHYPAAQVPRSMLRELWRFFCSPGCGWLDLDVSGPVVDVPVPPSRLEVEVPLPPEMTAALARVPDVPD